MKKNDKRKKRFKIIFQIINPNLFRSVYIGYLYEIAKENNVVLLTERVDSYTEKILNNRKLFPGLEKIIFLNSIFNGNVFIENHRLYKKLKIAVNNYNPDIVITHSDTWPADMYLLRLAKELKALTAVLQPGFKVDTAGKKKLYIWSCLMNSHFKMPSFLPFFIRMFFVKFKKYLGYFFYHWILPLSVLEAPFFGKTSFVFWDDAYGLRDVDYSAVFSKRDHKLYLKDGVNSQKLFIIGHPLEHKTTREFFEKVYFSKNKEKPAQTRQRGENEVGPPKSSKAGFGGENAKTLTIMWPEERIGFTEEKYLLISEKKMRENRINIVKLLSNNLPDWKIFIKSHPSTRNILEIKNFINSISNNIFVVDPLEPADKYIEMSEVIIGITPPSTTILTASFQCPEKIILFLNLSDEFLGDCYKDFDGIEYIDNENKLVNVLNLIRNNKYHKKPIIDSNFDFKSVNELLDHIHHLKNKQKV